MNAKALARGILPPIMADALRGVIASVRKDRVRFTGDFSSWQEADFITDVVRHESQYILVDRTSFLRDGRERLTVQHTPEFIYPAKYPCWFLSGERFTDTFAGRYEMLGDFTAYDTTQPQGGEAEYKGFIFRLKTSP